MVHQRRVSEDLPGIGGRLRTTPEDFLVEEIPLYEACGEGTHAYLTLEKEGIDTLGAIRRLAHVLERKDRDFGYAGIKDAHARTRQQVSLEHPLQSDEELLEVEVPGVRIVDVRRHRNKIKIGHLMGNRFSIRVRDVHDEAQERARQIIERLQKRGLPNFFGEQRFGNLANTHKLGRALVGRDAEAFFSHLIAPEEERGFPKEAQVRDAFRHGDFDGAIHALPRAAVHERRALAALARNRGQRDAALKRLDRRMLRFYVSAYQSALFNQILSDRFESYDSIQVGDVACLHRNGALFRVESLEAEASRAEAFEISATGPIFGPKMLTPEGEVAAREEALLQSEGVTAKEFGTLNLAGLKGARRPLRVPLGEVEVSQEEKVLTVSFSLPPGSYATVFLDELMQNPREAVGV